jgi:hypothetical protein
MPFERQLILTRDILTAWDAINNGVVAQNNRTREKYWAHWRTYCTSFNQDPFLQLLTPNQQVLLLTAFAARVRTGCYGKGNPIKVQGVANALSSITKTFELVGLNSPIYQAPGTYKVPVARLMEGYRREDPPAVPQLAVPIRVPNKVRQTGYATNDHKLQAIGDLAVIAFYYLLRVGEYTRPRMITTPQGKKRATRTIQFHIRDVGFFKNHKILPRNSPLHILLTADECTLKISNQKNGRMGETIHHHAISSPHCPVKCLANRVHHVLSHKGTTDNLICDVWNKMKQTWISITSTEMRKHLRQSVADLNLKQQGIDPDLIGVHSLRAGGAMALKLSGSDNMTIMKLGRWTSLTFLQYIHNQIAHLSAELSQNMSTNLHYTNIAAIEAA